MVLLIRSILLVLLSCGSGCSVSYRVPTLADVVPARGENPKQVSLEQLLKNPDNYDGLYIRVVALVKSEFEYSILEPIRPVEVSIGGDIWFRATGLKIEERLKTLNGYVCRLDGVFHAGPLGHMGMGKGMLYVNELIKL